MLVLALALLERCLLGAMGSWTLRTLSRLSCCSWLVVSRPPLLQPLPPPDLAVLAADRADRGTFFPRCIASGFIDPDFEAENDDDDDDDNGSLGFGGAGFGFGFGFCFGFGRVLPSASASSRSSWSQ